MAHSAMSPLSPIKKVAERIPLPAFSVHPSGAVHLKSMLLPPLDIPAEEINGLAPEPREWCGFFPAGDICISR